jgi:hypothetical protein
MQVMRHLSRNKCSHSRSWRAALNTVTVRLHLGCVSFVMLVMCKHNNNVSAGWVGAERCCCACAEDVLASREIVDYALALSRNPASLKVLSLMWHSGGASHGGGRHDIVSTGSDMR